MRNLAPFSKRLRTLWPAIGLFCLAPVLFAAEAPPEKFEPPKSVFEISPTGKDPFYPSVAPVGQKVQTSTNTSGTVRTGPVVVTPQPPTLLSMVKLEGINYTARGGTAIINGQKFKAGESAKVYVSAPGAAKPGGGFVGVNIRCLEVTKDCVKITVGDEPDPKMLCLR
jgi:hypothetical protein